METSTKTIPRSVEPLHLLLVGNNPIELSSILGKVQMIPGNKIITEIAFDLKSLFERLMNFRPNYILIDDNIGKPELTEALQALAGNRKTKDIPVTVLKNSNYEETRGSSSVLDYVLKQNISTESILNTVKNSIKSRRTQLFLYKAYNMRKRQLAGA
jgi:DNA-binding NarL/FixJ family response regulator